MYKQIIIVRKDLNMSHGKMAAQVSHASMAFLTTMIRDNTFKINPYRYSVADIHGRIGHYRRNDLHEWALEAYERGEEYFYAKPVNPNDPNGKLELCNEYYLYSTMLRIDKDLYEQWIDSEFTKVILQAKNKNNLLKAKTMAEELGMKEGEDFFLIRDNCHTELYPEDEDGRTLTCIGFKPMDAEVIDKISKKYHLYT